MRKISLFIAMSLDGYIADNKGGVNWLKGQDENDNTNKSYSEFIGKNRYNNHGMEYVSSICYRTLTGFLAI